MTVVHVRPCPACRKLFREEQDVSAYSHPAPDNCVNPEAWVFFDAMVRARAVVLGYDLAVLALQREGRIPLDFPYAAARAR